MSTRRGGRVWLVDDFEFREIVKNSLSYSECLRSLGLKTRGGAASKSLKERISILNCSTQHFYKQKWERGVAGRRVDLKDILIRNSTFKNMASLKRKLIESQLLVYECNICKLNSWLGNEISLHIDHINGINTDNRLDNLRLLCPNCHSQTETYAGKNNRSVCSNKICIKCGAVNSSDSNRCRKCFYIDSRKSQRPTRNELKSMIRNTSFTSIGNKYGVSDNAIRKWCKSMDLPYKKQEISAYSQLEWLNV